MRLTRAAPRPMTAADFGAFLDAAREARGWSQAEVARRLGCAPNTMKNWRERGAPAHAALACAALLRGLGPWRPHKAEELR